MKTLTCNWDSIAIQAILYFTMFKFPTSDSKWVNPQVVLVLSFNLKRGKCDKHNQKTELVVS